MPGESDITLEIVEETPIVLELVQTGPSGAAGGVQSIVAGDNVTVDDTDPENPIVSADDAPVQSVNGQTGVAVLDQDDVLDGTTYKQYSQTEKTKLAGIEAGAEVNTVDSVAGKTGVVTLVKGDVGLGNVDNTSDANKPVSTATQTALDAKVTGPASATDDLPAVFDGITGKLIKQKTYSAFKTLLALVKGDVGLGNVDNTSDANKPVSSATQTALNLKQDLSEKDQANGYAGLDSSSKINPSQLPALAITETFVVASQVAMLALTAQIGDVAVRSDLNKTFILTAEPASTLGNWQELLTPTDAVSSVFGRSGVVTAQNGDYTASQVTNVPSGSVGGTTVQAAIDELEAEKQPLDSDLTSIAGLSPSNDDVIQRKSGAWTNRTMAQVKTDLALTKSDVGLSNVDNTSDATKNSATATLTNKRVEPRVGTVASSATPTINTDNVDAFSITALAANITSMTTNLSGTPTDFQKLTIRIKDNGTARTIAWGASFAANGAALPTTTVISKLLTVGFIWNGSTWGCVASAQEA